MLIKKKTGLEIPSSEITSESLYRSRRKFMAGAAGTALGTVLAACTGNTPEPSVTIYPDRGSAADGGRATPEAPFASAETDELGDPLNSYSDVTGYNNYYEFTTDKVTVAQRAKDFKFDPWSFEVSGLVNNPKTFDMDDVRQMFDQEERIYRLRCVEGWSMVIPWNGFPLSKLLDMVEPTSAAKYVRFETVFNPEQMPEQNSRWFPWPYVEGLRLDEAMNDLAILATGVYGQDLLAQNGAPIRLQVPWKYGFKSIKSIVKIELTDEQPTSLWMASNGNEYGFYANVNPNVPHPRWSQATERRIGELGRRETLMFNGYEEQVAYLYEGMNLAVDY